ncbi:GNAT family N-acetyltransferase [Limosilactobacillus reuteri]|nr:GNAT family N-acetyltransferase [Limosilactobacillus reuteri]MDD1405819.1 GNAT family N-acetyltransferase [Limosilactobacillus reuteri]
MHEDYRQQHLGRDLLTYAQKQIEDHLDIRTVIAYIYIENQASYHLFTSCGYKE